jgi:hypothetical protein
MNNLKIMFGLSYRYFYVEKRVKLLIFSSIIAWCATPSAHMKRWWGGGGFTLSRF